MRGYAANSMVVKSLKSSDVPKDEKERAKKFREVLKSVAERVGHQQATLKKHYLLPGLEEDYVKKGNVLSVKEAADSSIVHRIAVDMMAIRVANDVQARWVKIVEGIASRLVVHVKNVYEKLFDDECELPDTIRVIVDDACLPEGKVGGFKLSKDLPWGVLTVSPEVFKMVGIGGRWSYPEAVILHELIHGSVGKDEPNAHGDKFQKMAKVFDIPKEYWD